MKNRIHAIITDMYDDQVYQDVIEQFNNLQEDNQLLNAFLQDLFQVLFQAFPIVAPIEEMARPYKFNHFQLSMLIETVEFKKMKAETTHDELAAGMTAIMFLHRLKGEWENDPELSKVLEKAQEVQRLEEYLERMLDEETVYNDLASRAKNDEQKREFEQRAQEANKKASVIGEKLNSLENELFVNIQAVQSKIRQSYRDIAENVTEEVAEIQAAVESWGSGAGEMGGVSPKERIELAKKMQANPYLKTLADMLGRMKNLATSKLEERLKKEPSMIVGVTLGNDLEGVLTEDLSLLSAAKSLFYNKYVEESLLQYQKEGKRKAGRGPIVALLDNSSSMQGIREMMLKAIILGGVLTVAAKEHRDVYLVFFADDVNAEFEFPKDMEQKDRVRTMLEVAEVGTAGGTDYVSPLRRGLEILATKEYQKADILFITDGICDVAGEFLETILEQKKRLGFRVVSVLLESDQVNALEGFSDKVYAFQEVGEGFAHAVLDELI